MTEIVTAIRDLAGNVIHFVAITIQGVANHVGNKIPNQPQEVTVVYAEPPRVHQRTERRTIKLSFIDILISICLCIAGFKSRVSTVAKPRSADPIEKNFIQSYQKYQSGIAFIPSQPPSFNVLGFIFSKALDEDVFQTDSSGRFESMDYIWVRLIPAICSALAVSLSFRLLRAVNCNRLMSILAAVCILINPIVKNNGRFASTDGIGQLFELSAVYFLVLMSNQKPRSLVWCGYAFIQTIATAIAAANQYSGWGVVILTVLNHLFSFRLISAIFVLGVSIMSTYNGFFLHTVITATNGWKGNPLELPSAIFRKLGEEKIIRASIKTFIQSIIRSIRFVDVESFVRSVMNLLFGFSWLEVFLKIALLFSLISLFRVRRGGSRSILLLAFLISIVVNMLVGHSESLIIIFGIVAVFSNAGSIIILVTAVFVMACLSKLSY